MDQRNRKPHRRLAAFLIGLVLCAVALQLRASSTDPTTALGFVADQVYQFNGIDNVNAFNGNLVVQIPIGKKYSIGDGLTYGLTLSYNSTIWKKEFLNIVNGVSESDPLQEITDSGPIPEDVPNRMFNAGLGWLFTLGDLRTVGQEENGGAPALIYTSPDGAEHVLYENLHVTGSTGPLPPNGTIGYTRDGTYMRMKQLSGGRWEIALPDGSRQLFLCDSCASTGHYDLTEIRGPLGEVLYVTRDNANNRLVLQETSKTAPVRTHYINYQHLANVPPYDNVVSSIQLEVNDAGTTCPRIATYTFNYTIARILRTPENLLNDPHYLRIPYADSVAGTINVPLLTSITMPPGSPSQPMTCGRCDASCPAAATESWAFDYAGYKDAQGNVVDSRIYPGWGANTARPYDASFFEGQLTRLTYPTGGSISYVYGKWGYPRRNCAPHNARNGGFEPMWSHSIGITSRQLKDAAGNNDGHPYYYIFGTTHPMTSTPGVDFCNLPKEYQVEIVDPVGNVTTHYFSIFMGQGANPGAGAPATADPFDPLDFGLPFSKFEPDPTQAAGAHTRWISERVYQCAANFFPGDLDLTTDQGPLALRNNALQVPSGCTPKRSTYRGFERSGDNCLHPTTPLNYSDDGCSAANRRLASMNTIYEDDQPSGTKAYRTESYSDFDGLGHYRTTAVDGNFATLSGAATTESRIDTTVYNPGRSLTSIPASGDAWFLESYTEKRASGAGSAPLRTLFQFAPCAIFVSGDYTAPCGYLAAERKLKNGLALGTDDLLTTYTRDTDSQVIYLDEVHYGGDPRPQESGLNTDESHWILPGAGPRYRVVHRREYDTHDTWTATSLYASLTGDSHTCPTLAVIGSAVLDRASGLPISTTDGSGATTSYTFDLQRRLTSVAPQGVARVTYGYTPFAAPASLASVSGIGTGFDVGYTYDGFGRLVHEQHRTSAALNDQETTYFPTGNVHTRSVLLDPNVSTNGRSTIYDRYDAFGRPQEVTPPGSKTTTIAYLGDRERDTTTFVGVDNRPSIKREYFDIQGRLAKVDEDLAPPTTSVQNYQSTLYTYDLLGNVVGVQQGSQSRSFIYDSLGHERSETIPELVPASSSVPSITPSITYDWYDAFGHPGRKTFAPGSPFNVTFDYDPIGRLITVRDAAGHPFKDYEYYGDLRCGDTPPALSAGKLRKATRHNNVPMAANTATTVDRILSEAFSYDSGNGKIATTTLMEETPGAKKTFATTFKYDSDRANLTRIDYPVCVGGQPCPVAPPSRSVANDYSYDQLISVKYGSSPSSATAALAAITYQRNGLYATVTHGNAVVDNQSLDRATYLPRPSNLTVDHLFGAGSISLGDLLYDSSGNLLQFGTDRYTYDHGSRVVSATNDTTGATYGYQYDRWGNLTSYNGTALGVDAATNHLTGISTTYDAAGNLTRWADPRPGADNPTTYSYDPSNMLTHLNSAGAGKVFLYTPADQRVVVIDYKVPTGNPSNPFTTRETWSLRGLGNEVLRDLESTGGVWSWKEDYFYRGGSLLASIRAAGIKHYHLDHLGSPRLVTDANGNVLVRHRYQPFGEEITNPDNDDERPRFTGHERDNNNPIPGARLGDIDYMHARYYNAMLGRFLSVDPAPANPAVPQSWNRYAYASNSPVNKSDPDGRESIVQNRARGNLASAHAGKVVADQVGAANVHAEVRVTDASGNVRFVDQGVTTKPGKIGMIEVKSGGATKTPSQAAFDTRAETEGVTLATKSRPEIGVKGEAMAVEFNVEVSYSASVVSKLAEALGPLSLVTMVFDIVNYTIEQRAAEKADQKIIRDYQRDPSNRMYELRYLAAGHEIHM